MSWIKKVGSAIFPNQDERRFHYYLHMTDAAGPNSNVTFKNAVAWGYLLGKGVEQDANEALFWFEQAANATDIYKEGDPGATSSLFYWFYYGRHPSAPELTIPVDYEKAIYWGHRHMTSSKYVFPVHVLMAKIYQNGMPGVAQNKREALAIYRYIGHSSHSFCDFRHFESAHQHPEVIDFTRETARQQVWELETGQNQRDAPEWFMKSELWYRHPNGKARRNKDGSLYYKSFDSWGPV